MAKKITASQPMSNRMKRRLNYFVSFFLLLFVGYIVANLFGLSVVRADEMVERSANQQMKSTTINANRGTIYDAKMEVLAQSSTVWTVDIAPNVIKELKYTDQQKDQLAQDLVNILGVDYEDIRAKIDKSESGFQYVKKKIDKPTADQIRELKREKEYSFIHLVEDTKRYYPKETLASQVIGFANTDDGSGKYGLEQEYDSLLKGTNGKIMTAVDAKGNPIPTNYEEKHDAIDGNSLVLTLDSTIQHFAESALDDIMLKHNPAGGACAIVMDVNTGAILAMANNPTYDLNNPTTLVPFYQQKLDNPTTTQETADGTITVPAQLTEEELTALKVDLRAEQSKNKAISWLYQPGSVFKIITGSAALETGIQTMDSTFNCTGSININGQVYHCHKREGQGLLDFTGMIVNSCNPAFINMGQLMGAETFCKFVDMFGITEPTGIDIFGEAQNSITVPLERMTAVDLASESFGQTMAITPLQMITATAAVVNGGYLLQPYLVDEILDNKGNVIEKTEPIVKRQIISEEVSKNMSYAMEQMISAGGGSTAYVKGYRIGGKSGTSQIGNRQDGKYVGSFVGVAPAQDPQIAVLVVVDTPTNGQYYGSQIAGPALGNILENTLNYLGISPEYSDEEMAAMEEPVPSVLNADISSAQVEIASKGLVPQVKGSGATVVDQMPKGGTTVAEGSKVILYTEVVSEPELATVPNVIGMTVAEANVAISNAGLSISMDGGVIAGNEGAVRVVSQSIGEGTQIPIGSVITVAYAREVTDLGEYAD